MISPDGTLTNLFLEVVARRQGRRAIYHSIKSVI